MVGGLTITIKSGELKNVRLGETPRVTGRSREVGAIGTLGTTPIKAAPPHTATVAAKIRSVHLNPPVWFRR